MLSLGIGFTSLLGLLLLAIHMLMVALTRALQTYSRSHLEELCEDRGHPDRVHEVDHEGVRTERSAEALIVQTGLLMVLLLGWALAVALEPEHRRVVAFGVVLFVGVLYLVAGALGRIHAESLIDRIWPFSNLVQWAALPWNTLGRLVELLIKRRDGTILRVPRPASVEVEIPASDDESDEDAEPELSELTRERLERLVGLNRTIVAELMTPRTSMVTLPETATFAEALQAFDTSGRSRIPLYGESRDDIVGVLYIKDLTSELLAHRSMEARVRKLARPPYWVPETKNAAELLDELRSRRVQIAIVLDEFGGVSGLVTLEDLLEEIIGAIDDEHDVPTPDDPILSLGSDAYEVDGALDLEELNDRLDLDLPTDEDYQTVGGLAFNALGRLPVPGDSFHAHNVDFTVLEVSENSIRRLRLDIRRPSATSGD